MITVSKCAQIAKQLLSEKRYIHTINVCDTAKALAEKFSENIEKAQIAALLHDILKEKTKEQLLLISQKNGIILDSVFKKPQALWHGPAAALYADTVLGITDNDILSAIDCHTTGKVGMAKLDKIIFLADMVSIERSYPGINQLRDVVFADLDKGMVQALEMNIEFIKEKGREVDNESITTLKWLKTGGI